MSSVSELLSAFTWYKQAAFLWRHAERVIYIDPWGLRGDLPVADLILITHLHFDHFSKDGPFAEPGVSHAEQGGGDIGLIRGPKTIFIAPHDVAKELTGDVRPVKPGDRIEAAGLKVEAVPAYNIVDARRSIHPKERNWVGYVLEHRGAAIYHAGDTDHLPELESVRTNAAFVPIGGAATMDVNEAATLVRRMKPSVAIPMHYGFMEGGRVGRKSDGERFRQEARPVEVHVFDPVNPFVSE